MNATAGTAVKRRRKLHGLSDVRRYFHRNEIPVYFISATNFNLLGMDEWVKNFKFISYLDCYDGRHPNTFVPPPLPHPDFQSIEDINNYLLQHPAVKDYVKRPRRQAQGRVPDVRARRPRGSQRKLGLQVWFPRARLRNGLDNKIQTRAGRRQGGRAVACPTCSPPSSSYAELRKGGQASGQGSRGPDALRRFGPYHLLHLHRGGLEALRIARSPPSAS